MRRRVCVVTGSRAEWGLLSPLCAELLRDARVELQTLVTGMHLAPAFGETWRAIEADGFPISARVDMQLGSDTPAGVTRSMGVGLIGMADALASLGPDLLVVLGDRFESLAAAAAALVARVPIAHLHGGEASEGVMDDAIRHAITKMAQLHFVAAEPYRRRVLQLGEAPERVFLVGALGLDTIAAQPVLDRAALSSALGFDVTAPYLLVTYHPATLGEEAGRACDRMLAALDGFPSHRVLLTRPNADPAHRAVGERIDAWVAAHADRAAVFTSLGPLRYVNALRHAAAVVGNSSSGILEAPSLGVPTVNIGDRQRGRLRAASIIDAPEETAAIGDAIGRALSPAFRASLAGVVSPFGEPGAARRIAAVLGEIPLDGLWQKRFHDLPGGA